MKLTFIGHSHIGCIERALKRDSGKNRNCSVQFLQLRNAAFLINKDAAEFERWHFQNHDLETIERIVIKTTQEASLTILYPFGNEHNIVSMVKRDLQEADLFRLIEANMQNYRHLLFALSHYVRSPAALLPPPPPIDSAIISEKPGIFAQQIAINGIASDAVRISAWGHQKRLLQQMAADCRLVFLELPQEVFSSNGLLHKQFEGGDPTHANDAYGELILCHLANFAAAPDPISTKSLQEIPRVQANIKEDDRQHPYMSLPNRAFWKQAVVQVPINQLDPVTDAPFRILHSDKIATAGSCFAQHISKKMRSNGFQFLLMENPVSNSASDGELGGYYDFSARYGNIYTTRQLVQLFDRAFGYLCPLDDYWTLPDNRFCDPFRPRIEPNGFTCVEDLVEDRQRHLAAVREMFSQLDIFIYTLGLTECWVSRLDGAAYPLAPGVAGGVFDPLKHEFVNLGVSEVASDLESFIGKLRIINPEAKLILTVSPVPLAATYEPHHVLVATTYSKSVLRVAADMVSRSCRGVYYFPSFEMISGSFNRGCYFGQDLRKVTEEGIDQVMGVFMRHLTERDGPLVASENSFQEQQMVDHDMHEMMTLAGVVCDEELLERTR